MKIIDFETIDGRSYVVPAQNIAYLSPNNGKSGTIIELVSGTILQATENINDLVKKLREA